MEGASRVMGTVARNSFHNEQRAEKLKCVGDTICDVRWRTEAEAPARLCWLMFVFERERVTNRTVACAAFSFEIAHFRTRFATSEVASARAVRSCFLWTVEM